MSGKDTSKTSTELHEAVKHTLQKIQRFFIQQDKEKSNEMTLARYCEWCTMPTTHSCMGDRLVNS